MEQASTATRPMTMPRPRWYSAFFPSQNGSVGDQGDLFGQPEPLVRSPCSMVQSTLPYAQDVLRHAGSNRQVEHSLGGGSQSLRTGRAMGKDGCRGRGKAQDLNLAIPSTFHSPPSREAPIDWRSSIDDGGTPRAAQARKEPRCLARERYSGHPDCEDCWRNLCQTDRRT